MGTCCGAHLQTKVRDYAKNAQNGAVTVTIIENPTDPAYVAHAGKCDYCQAPAEFTVSYYPKRPEEVKRLRENSS